MHGKVRYLINNGFIPKDSELLKKIHNGEVNHLAIASSCPDIAGVSFKGLREYQEDRIDVDEVSDFDKLTCLQQNHVINETIAEMQHALVHYHPGSCLLSSIIFPIFNKQQQLIAHHIVTVNLGDSESILITQANDNISLEVLNTSHRLPETAYIEDIRHKKNINVERAFGDKDFPKLIRTADITHKIVKKHENEEHFLMLFSDGVREASELTNELNEIFDIHRYSVSTIAKKISDAAWKSGSHDNISVLVMSLNQYQIKPYALSIYDGHGGDDVSKILSEKFIKSLEKHIRTELAHGPEPEHSNRDTIIKKKKACHVPNPFVKCMSFFRHSKSRLSKHPKSTQEECQQRQYR